MERRLSEARGACRAAEKTAKENEERVSALRQVHLHSLRQLESTVGQALGDAVASARQIGSGTGDLAFAGGE